MSLLAFRSQLGRLLAGGILLLGAASTTHGQTTLTWTGNGADSNWTDVSNWMGGGYPNNGQPSMSSTYNATINFGGPVLNTNITLVNVMLGSGAGTISGGSNLNVNGLLSWMGGTIGGTGTTTLSGGATIDTTNAFVYLDRTLNNASGSTVTLTAPNALYSYTANADWTNQTGSTFTIASNASLLTSGGIGTFLNSSGATFQKTGGTGTSFVAWNFTNNGTVNATSGVLDFNGSSTQNGTVTIGTGATVQFDGTSHTWTGTAGSSGAGAVQFASGTVLFNGANNLASNVSLTSATVDGTGSLTISGPFSWTGGYMGALSSPGAGTTTLTGGAAFDTTNANLYLNRTLFNASGSTVTLTAPNALYSYSANASWTNQTGSTFTIASNAGLLISAGIGTFLNSSGATFQKTGGTGTSFVAWNFTNNGTVNATSGVLDFNGSSTQNGAVTIGTGATVQFDGTTHTWTGTAGSSGAGAVQFASGTVLFNGANNLASNVSLTSATVDGTGSLTISGPFSWTGGYMGALSSPGAGTTTLTGGAAFDTTNSSLYLNRTLFNASGSTVTLTAPNPLYSYSANAAWTNQTGSTFTIASNASLLISAGIGTFLNSSGATFQKTGGTGTSFVAWNFTNNGTVNATNGVLDFNGSSTQNGTVTIGTGATVQFDGTSHTWTGTAGSSGAGTVQFASGTALFNGTNNLASNVSLTSATIDGTGSLTISGPFSWTGGYMGALSSPGAGTTTLSGGAILDTTNANLYLNRSVTNANNSTVTLGGPNNLISYTANATWNNQSGSTFTIASNASLITSAGTGTFTNNGAFQKTGGTGTSSVGWNFSNTGTVLAQSGTLSFSSSVNLTNYVSGTLTGGAWRVLAGATLDLTTSRPITTIAAGTTVELNGVGSAFAELENNVTADAGTLNILGGRVFTPGGTLIDTGIVTVGQAARDGSQFSGAVTVNSGGLLRGSGAVSGAVTVATGGTVSANGFNFTIGSLSGPAGTVNNNATTAGSLTVGTDNTSTSFGGTIADGGTGPLSLVKVGAGTLTLSGTNTSTGGLSIVSGTLQVPTDVALGNGPITFNTVGTLAYSGNTTTARLLNLNGGTLAVTAGKTLTLNGDQVANGFLDGAGTIATSAANGAQLVGLASSPSVNVVSNNSNDRSVHFDNSGAFSLAAGVNTGGNFNTTNLSGFTTEGTGSVTIGAGSQLNVANFQSYGMMNLTPATVSGQFTELANLGTAPLGFNGGSQTFVGTAAAPNANVVGVDLHGQNMVIQGGLFVNNGLVFTSTGSSTIFVDYGATYKGAGTTNVPIVTQNGGKVLFGNCPGVATFGSLVIGSGGIGTLEWEINDAGPSATYPNAPGVAGPKTVPTVSGWSLGLVASQTLRGGTATYGNFSWTATPGAKFDLDLETLAGPSTVVGSNPDGLMADFDPTQSYSWPIIAYQGVYSGPTSDAQLTADTVFDRSQFANALPAGAEFGLHLDQYPTGGGELDLVFTPSPVPEPGTLALTGLAGLAAGCVARRRRIAR